MKNNIDQSLNSQKTSFTSPSRASYGMSIVRILEKIDRVITAPECILTHLPHKYASVNWASIISGNGLAPVRRQAIT